MARCSLCKELAKKHSLNPACIADFWIFQNLEQPDIEALIHHTRAENFSAGQIILKQGETTNRILIASSSMATELIKGRTLDEAWTLTNKAVAEALDGLPPIKMHCSVLAEEAVHKAINDYRVSVGLEPWDYQEHDDMHAQVHGES